MEITGLVAIIRLPWWWRAARLAVFLAAWWLVRVRGRDVDDVAGRLGDALGKWLEKGARVTVVPVRSSGREMAL